MRLTTVFILMVLSSCNNSEVIKTSNQFFQVREYFIKQAESLKKNNVHLQKSINRDNKIESKNILSVDWKKELRPFEDCDLNKPAWKKSYKADTFYLSNQTHLIYKALEPKLSVRKLEVILHADTVIMLNINIEKKNAYYQSSQQLHYEPWKGYTVIGSQKVILADPTNFNIKAIFN